VSLRPALRRLAAAALLAPAALAAQTQPAPPPSAPPAPRVPVAPTPQPAPSGAATAAPAAAARAADTNTTSFAVGGLQVILRRVSANNVVAANLYLLGGTRQVNPAQAGIEPFLLAASERGTTGYPRDSMRATMARLGAIIGVDADHDWTTFALRSTAATFDSSWAVFADRVMRPTLDSAEVELVRAQAVGAVRQRRDSPDAQLEFLADSVAFAGYSYAVSPSGTEASLRRLPLVALRRYHQQQMVTSRMLLVVVGDVTRPRLQQLVATTLAQLPRGSYRWAPPSPPPAWGSSLVTERRALPTNYVRGYFPGAAAWSPDYFPLRIAASVLTGRFFSEIRSKRNLSYAVSAPFLDRATAAAGVYVTTTDPTTTLRLMREELTNLQEGWITPQGLNQLTQQFITEYFLDNETNADQANSLARAQLYRNDWRRAATFADELRAVTPDDVRRVARQYLRGLRLAYVGDPSKLDAGLVRLF
jgi:zinc protease